MYCTVFLNRTSAMRRKSTTVFFLSYNYIVLVGQKERLDINELPYQSYTVVTKQVFKLCEMSKNKSLKKLLNA